MRAAAADLDFETAARLRDEIKRLHAVELTVADDPLARQGDVEAGGGGFRGDSKYGAAANLPPRGAQADGRRHGAASFRWRGSAAERAQAGGTRGGRR